MDSQSNSYEVRVNLAKNRIYIFFRGFMKDEVVKAAVDQIVAGVDRLKPGFDVITDISTFRPAGKQGTEEITRGQDYINRHGVHRIVRVVDAKKNLVSQNQFARLSENTYDKKINIESVGSLAEAESLLES
jgi:hypothetical protein